MRHFLSLILISIIQIAQAQNPADILRKHFEDYGQEQWNEVRTVVIDGKLVDKNYYAASMKLTFKQPDKIRVEGTYKGKKFAEAYDGTTGWIMAPWKNKYEVQYMKTEEEMILSNSFCQGSPLYKFRDHLNFLGLKNMEGVVYLAFQLDETNYIHTFYLDKENYRLYYEEITSKYGSNTSTILKVIDKYKSYGKMLMPISMIFEGEDIYSEYVFDQVYLGMGANDNLFSYPENR